MVISRAALNDLLNDSLKPGVSPAGSGVYRPFLKPGVKAVGQGLSKISRNPKSVRKLPPQIVALRPRVRFLANGHEHRSLG